MLHTDQISVARHLGSGKIGLEKESLRITKEGFMTQTRDPFVDVPCIVSLRKSDGNQYACAKQRA